MQEHAVIIGGFEPVYMQKLALYLGSRFGESVRVGIAEAPPLSVDPDTVWIGSERFLEEVRSRSTEAHCILLAEDADDTSIHRYQSCEKLYQKLILKYRQFYGVPVDTSGTGRQRWLVITTDGAAASLLAFSVTCAQILGERGRILYLNLSECSGMAELFLLERGTDLSDLVSALRKDEQVCLEAFVRQIEQIDYIMPPSNPSILHELLESDVARLIRTVEGQEEYRYVIVALGTTCCGCEQFFRRAKRIFHLTKKETFRECSQREWLDFISLCLGSQRIPVERVYLPQITAGSSGIHLIRAWQEGGLGQLVRSCLGGEETG